MLNILLFGGLNLRLRLRSATTSSLVGRRIQRAIIGELCFYRAAAPAVWNSLEVWSATSLPVFRQRLKFEFFKRSLGRPGTVVPDGLLFYRRFFFFRQPNLRGPSDDRRETLPHDRNLAAIAG